MPPVLSLVNPSQIQSITGRTPRAVLADVTRARAPEALLNRQIRDEDARLELAEDAQARAQRDQAIGTAIQGVGTVGTLGFLGAKTGLLQGVFGGGTAAAPSVASTAAGVGATAAAEGAAGAAGAGVAAAAPAAAEAGAATGVATGGSALAGAAPLAGAAGLGAAAGLVGGFLGEQLPGPGAGKGAFGAVSGAVGGFALGGPIGAGVGALVGGLKGAGICMIVTACHGPDSEEVEVTRRFRDAKMTKIQLRAYYYLSEQLLVPKMQADPAFKQAIKMRLVDPLVRYGRFVVGMPLSAPPPSFEDTQVAQKFLDFLTALGHVMPSYVRQNGEVY